MDVRKLRVGDIVMIHTLSKNENRLETARLTFVEHDKEIGGQIGVQFIYKPCSREDSVDCGFGSSHLIYDAPRPNYGWYVVGVVGFEKPKRIPLFTPKPGDRSYDLMC